MSNNSFKVRNALTLTPVDLTTILNPQAGDLACDINDSNKIKRYDDNLLSWAEVGSASAGNVDSLLTQTFDSAALSTFTQTGLALATSSKINGAQTARLIHQAGVSPTNDQSFKQTISVDRKYRGKIMQLSLQDRSTASEGNLVLKVRNETGAADIIVSDSIQTDSQSIAAISTTSASAVLSGFSNSVINGLSIGMSVTGAGIPTGTVINSINSALLQVTMSANATASASITLKVSALPLRRTFSFTVPKDCASLSYTVTALPEAGLPESYIDDLVIQLASTALLETSVTVPVLTAWQSYTPTFQGFGSPSAIEMQWRQNGQNVEVRGKFISGVTTAVEARVGLPAGLSSAGVGVIPSLQLAGIFGINSTQTVTNFVTIEPSVSYFTLSRNDGATSGALEKRLGNAVVATGGIISFTASVPCAGLSATVDKVIPLTQSGLIQEGDSSVQLSSATAAAAGNSIATGFVVVNNTGDAFTATTNKVTVLKDGVYTITTSGDGSNGTGLQIFINGVAYSGHYSYALTGGSQRIPLTISPLLTANDYIEVKQIGTAAATSVRLSISHQGSLKQVSVSSDQKIKIPTSELRFEGASTRGTGADTAIVKFDTLAKIRGDAFSVVSTAAEGTAITMLKAGKLDVSTSIYNFAVTSPLLLITKNQVVRTIRGTTSETISTSYNAAANNILLASATTFVNIGDVIRVNYPAAAPTGDPSNIFNLSFQEQDISVSVTNTLPQFSESDSSVRVDTANGYGSTSLNKIRRFSNVRDNIGTDVEYVDSAVNGASFTAKSSGIYV
jgi:hypothetical protein